jgi:hypothetical protein
MMMMMMNMMIIKKAHTFDHKYSCLFYVWENSLRYFSAEMGLRRIIHILKYTRENSCTVSCLKLNDISFFELTIL